MGIGKRLKNLWELSVIEIPPEDAAPLLFRKESEKAEFIMPNRVEEIIKNKEDVTLDDVLI